MISTAFISQNIAKVSTRGFQQNVEALAGEPLRVRKLGALNNSLDVLYEMLYGQINSITKEDYALIGPQLSLLIDTIKDLYKTCRRLGGTPEMRKETERLAKNYAALYELDKDILDYRIRSIPTNLVNAIEAAGSILNSL